MKKFIHFFFVFVLAFLLVACKKTSLKIAKTSYQVKAGEEFKVEADFKGELECQSSDEETVKVVDLSKLTFKALKEGTAELKFSIKNSKVTPVTVKVTVTKGEEPKPTEKVTVSFDLQGGTGTFAPVTINKGQKVTKPTVVPTKSGFTFKHWSTEVNGPEFDFNTSVNNSLTLYAVWETTSSDKVTVSFDLQGGTGAFDPITINKGEKVTKPTAVPTKTDYTFKHWSQEANGPEFDFETTVNDNLTLYAVWEAVVPDKVTVTFDLQGGTGTFDPVELDKGAQLTKPGTDPAKDDHTFKHWSAEVNGPEFDFATPINSNTTLYAVWAKNLAADEVRVTFDLQGGGNYADFQEVILKKDQFLPEPKTPTKEHYTFTEWQVDGVKFAFKDKKSVKKVDKDITLVAQYTKTMRRVRFESNGIFNVETQQIWDGQEINVLDIQPKRDGYEFQGWFLDLECTQPVEGPVAITGNKTFYAKVLNKQEPNLYVARYNIYEKTWEILKRSITTLNVESGAQTIVPVYAENVDDWLNKVEITEISEEKILSINGRTIQGVKFGTTTVKVTLKGYDTNKVYKNLKVTVTEPEITITNTTVFKDVETTTLINVKGLVGYHPVEVENGTNVVATKVYNNLFKVKGTLVGSQTFKVKIPSLGYEKEVSLEVKERPALKIEKGAIVDEFNTFPIRVGETIDMPVHSNVPGATFTFEFLNASQTAFTISDGKISVNPGTSQGAVEQVRCTLTGYGETKKLVLKATVSGAVLVTIDSSQPSDLGNLRYQTFEEAYNTCGGNTEYRFINDAQITTSDGKPVEIKHPNVRLTTSNSSKPVTGPRDPEITVNLQIKLQENATGFEVSGFTWSDQSQLVFVPLLANPDGATSANPFRNHSNVLVMNNIINNNIPTKTTESKTSNKHNPENANDSLKQASIVYFEHTGTTVNSYLENLAIIGNKFVAGANDPYIAMMLDNSVNLTIQDNIFEGFKYHAIAHECNAKGLSSNPRLINNKFNLVSGQSIAFISYWTSHLPSDSGEATVTVEGNTFENCDVAFAPGASNNGDRYAKFSVSYNTFKNVTTPIDLLRLLPGYNYEIIGNTFEDCDHVFGSNNIKPIANELPPYYNVSGKPKFESNAWIKAGVYEEFTDANLFGTYLKKFAEHFTVEEANLGRAKNAGENITATYTAPEYGLPTAINLTGVIKNVNSNTIHEVSASVSPASGKFTLAWESSDSTIIEVVNDPQDTHKVKLIMHKEGVATITCKTQLADPTKNIEQKFEVVVVDKDVRISIAKNVLNVNERSKVTAAINGNIFGLDAFNVEAQNPAVAEWDALTSEVVAKSAGIATFKLTVAGVEKFFHVTVYHRDGFHHQEVMDLLIESHKTTAFHEYTRACASCNPEDFEYNNSVYDSYSKRNWWNQDTYGSVSRILFQDLVTVTDKTGDIETYKNFKNKHGNNIMSGDLIDYTKPVYIVAHDTGNTQKGSNAIANINYLLNEWNTASWHYIADEQGVHRIIPDEYQVWHAGDGGSTLAELIDTGVPATGDHPFFQLSPDGRKLMVDGTLTNVDVPTTNSGLTAIGFARCGIQYEKGSNGNWFVNKLYTHSNRYVCTRCGISSIAMEGVVERGTDWYMMWHNQAKLIGELMVKHNIPISRVLTHNNCSNKDCASALINAIPGERGYLDEFKAMADAEHKYLKFKKDGYTITVEMLSELLDANGHFKASPLTSQEVSYKVTVEKGGNTDTLTLYTNIFGSLTMRKWWEYNYESTNIEAYEALNPKH